MIMLNLQRMRAEGRSSSPGIIVNIPRRKPR